jgi:hypothetical protein
MKNLELSYSNGFFVITDFFWWIFLGFAVIFYVMDLGKLVNDFLE